MDHPDSQPAGEAASPTAAVEGRLDKSRDTLTEEQSGLYPQFILFGDSITQNWSSTVQCRLQTSYTRRADIVNRGFSGYTTTLALTTLRYILPLSILDSCQPQPPIRLLTVFFGANDACLPENAQHVPLDLYLTNIRHIVNYAVFKQHRTRVILITPPPINEWQLSRPLTRTATRAKDYAQATRELAEELQIPCLDLWTVFMRLAGYNHFPQTEEQMTGISTKEDDNTDTRHEQTLDQSGSSNESSLPGSLCCPPNKVLPELLLDGLHVTEHGCEILYDELTRLIRKDIPEYAPENMPMVFQDYKIILGIQKPSTGSAPVTGAETMSDDQPGKDVDSTLEADATSESWTEVTSANVEEG